MQIIVEHMSKLVCCRRRRSNYSNLLNSPNMDDPNWIRQFMDFLCDSFTPAAAAAAAAAATEKRDNNTDDVVAAVAAATTTTTSSSSTIGNNRRRDRKQNTHANDAMIGNSAIITEENYYSPYLDTKCIDDESTNLNNADNNNCDDDDCIILPSSSSSAPPPPPPPPTSSSYSRWLALALNSDFTSTDFAATATQIPFVSIGNRIMTTIPALRCDNGGNALPI